MSRTTIADATPAWAPDFVAKRAEQLAAMRAEFGVYRYADGRPVPLRPASTATLPVSSFADGRALLTYWNRLGRDMLDQATLQYRATLNDRAAQAASKVKPVVDRFKRDSAAWIARWGSANGGSDIDRAAELWELLRDHSIALSGAMWSGYSIETSFERAIWAVKSSAKELGEKVSAPMWRALTAGESLLTIVKWAAVGLVGVVAVWGVSRLFRSGGAR